MLEKLQQFLPILGLLVVITFVILSLPKIDLGHSPAFRRRRVLNWLPLGLTYAFLYMGRYNLNVAKVAGIMTKDELGTITFYGTMTYAIAFLVNGPIADRVGGRATILVAAIGAALANALMGFALRFDTGVDVRTAYAFLYPLNMYFQSFGAVSIVKVNASWFHIRERGTFGGIFGILISLGLYFAYDWGTPIVENHPAEWVFFIPALVLFGFALLDYFLVFDEPAGAGHRNFDTGDASSGDDGPRLPVFEVARRMLSNPVIVTIALIEMCSGFIRGSIMKWGYIFANETNQQFAQRNWGVLLCAAGILGGVFAGVISDRVFQSRRGPSAVILYALCALTLAITAALISSPISVLVLIVCIMSVIGVHGMLSGTASMDFGGRKNVGVAVGLIDGMVYLGFGLQSLVIGKVLPTGDAQADPRNWRVWLLITLPVAIVGLLLSLRIWNAKPTPRSAAAKPPDALEEAA